MSSLSTDINTCSCSNVLTNDYESILVRYMNQKWHFLIPKGWEPVPKNCLLDKEERGDRGGGESLSSLSPTEDSSTSLCDGGLSLGGIVLRNNINV
jgi:hypothetical protein